MKKIFTKAAVNKAARALTAGFLLVSSPLSHAEEGHKKTGHENVGQGVLVTLGTAVGIAGGSLGGLLSGEENTIRKMPKFRVLTVLPAPVTAVKAPFVCIYPKKANGEALQKASPWSVFKS